MSDEREEQVEVPVQGEKKAQEAEQMWPVTEEEEVRWAVFLDLKRRGYSITSGAKFGADYLAYPGDPALYHASFSVRLARDDTPIHPLTLAAATRMSHAARKHVLIASASPSESSSVSYIAVGPDVPLSSQRPFREGVV